MRTDEDQIRALIEQWAAAVHRGDMDGVEALQRDVGDCRDTTRDRVSSARHPKGWPRISAMPDRIREPSRIPDLVRRRRLREDARRPMRTNLAEGIALSHTLMRFVGAARRG